MSDPAKGQLDPNKSTEALVSDDGMTLQVPNKHISRLIQLGIHADREDRQRKARRQEQRRARRRNRSN